MCSNVFQRIVPPIDDFHADQIRLAGGSDGAYLLAGVLNVGKGTLYSTASVGGAAGSLAYRKPDEAVGPTALAVAPVCPQCVWKKSAADSASVLGLPSISPDIIRLMTTSRIAS